MFPYTTHGYGMSFLPAEGLLPPPSCRLWSGVVPAPPVVTSGQVGANTTGIMSAFMSHHVLKMTHEKNPIKLLDWQHSLPSLDAYVLLKSFTLYISQIQVVLSKHF